MKIPTTLKHKPVIVAENYDSIDGRGAYHSDAKGLSLGPAQWNDRGKVDISAKVWRHTGEKWSRQSEELPMHRVLDLAERVMRDGVMIGAYFSQWFANTTLQPLDHALRERGPEVTHYLRYMDNFTLYARSKRQLDRAIKMIEDWLKAHDLTIKDDWQKFRTADRMPTALGYRFGRGYTYLRKRNLFRMTRQLHSLRRKLARGTRIPVSLAFGLLSRLGQLKHCSSVHLYRRLVRKGTQKMMKQVVREYMRKERRRWNISLAQTA